MARLLIIDDEKSLCQVLEIAFRKKGHWVETVSNGQAAKKKIESQVYDLIISDIRMPDLYRNRVVGVCPRDSQPRAVHFDYRCAHRFHRHHGV